MTALLRLLVVVLLPQAPAAAWASPPPPEQQAPIPIRVVVVTAFEIGADTGDKAGEFQAWAERYPRQLPFPAGDRPLRHDPASAVLVVSTGMGTGRAATSIMALGLDRRFDLRRAYWLVAAIAGVNPGEASVGSAAWVGRVIDTDYGYEIDAREVPAGWPTGRLPWERSSPYAQPVPADRSGNLFTLNLGLRDWAYERTRTIKLPDSATLRAIRGRYHGFPKALGPPVVMTGDEATGQTFWHGALLNRFAEEWTRYWTHGHGRFVMTGMEDSGVARALDALEALDRADRDRLMVLRTAANYSMPPPGTTAAESLANENSALSGLEASLHAAYRVALPVVDEISSRWDRYADTVPGPGGGSRAAAGSNR